jgi:hypothetical protein
VRTAWTLLSAIVWAAAIPAPWLALTDVFSTDSTAPESVSTITNHGALPKALSVADDKSFPAAVMHNFITKPP